MSTKSHDQPGEKLSKRDQRLQVMATLGDGKYDTSGYPKTPDDMPSFTDRISRYPEIRSLFKLVFGHLVELRPEVGNDDGLPTRILYDSMRTWRLEDADDLKADPPVYAAMPRFNRLLEYAYRRDGGSVVQSEDPDDVVHGFVQLNDHVASQSVLSSALHSAKYTWLTSSENKNPQPTTIRPIQFFENHDLTANLRRLKDERGHRLKEVKANDPEDKELHAAVQSVRDDYAEQLDRITRNGEVHALVPARWYVSDQHLTTSVLFAPYPVRDFDIPADKHGAIYWPNDPRHPAHDPDAFLTDDGVKEMLRIGANESYNQAKERAEQIASASDNEIVIDFDNVHGEIMDYPFMLEFFDYLQESDDWRWHELIAELDEKNIVTPFEFISWMNQHEVVNTGESKRDPELAIKHGAPASIFSPRFASLTLHLVEPNVRPTPENNYLPQVELDDNGDSTDMARYSSTATAYITPNSTAYIHFILLAWTVFDLALRDPYVKETAGVDTSNCVYRLSREEMNEIDRELKESSSGRGRERKQREQRPATGVSSSVKTRARRKRGADTAGAQKNDAKYAPAIDRRIRDMAKDERALKLLSLIDINQPGTKVRFDCFVYRFEPETVAKNGEEVTHEPGVYISRTGNEFDDVRIDAIHETIMERQREIEHEAWEARDASRRKPFKQRKNPLALASMRDIKRMGNLAKDTLGNVKKIVGVTAAYEAVETVEGDEEEGDDD